MGLQGKTYVALDFLRHHLESKKKRVIRVIFVVDECFLLHLRNKASCRGNSFATVRSAVKFARLSSSIY